MGDLSGIIRLKVLSAHTGWDLSFVNVVQSVSEYVVQGSAQQIALICIKYQLETC